MQLLNYHELTMNEPKNSPQRRLQFSVICGIMAFCLVYSVHISGVLLTIEPFETKFPGGNFCYKKFSRDYVTSMGIGRRLQKEVLEAFPEEDDKAVGISVKDRKKIIEDKVYHVYLDNPKEVGGVFSRWFSGVLVSDNEKVSYCDPLFEKNPTIQREYESHKDVPDNEKSAKDLFHETVYEHLALPSVDSLAIKFPFTDGFSGSLALNYKIIPEMRQLAAEKGYEGNNPVVISQCSKREGICTHYIPLVKGIDFHAGLPSTEEHQKMNPTETFDFIEAMRGGLRVVFPFLKPYIERKSASSSLNDNAEL